MTKTQQRQFIRELISNVRKDILLQVPLLPEAWDGHELREFIAERFQEASFTIRENKRRYRDYKNAVLIIGRRG